MKNSIFFLFEIFRREIFFNHVHYYKVTEMYTENMYPNERYN